MDGGEKEEDRTMDNHRFYEHFNLTVNFATMQSMFKREKKGSVEEQREEHHRQE
jgi:hypothetical protein